MRAESVETDGGPEDYIPEECCFHGCNEMGGLDADGKPHCFRYRDTLDPTVR